MPVQDGTLTPDDVAGWLGVPVSDRMVDATDAARRWAQDRRSLTDPDLLWREPDAWLGGVLYASLTFEARATPQGFAGYDETGAVYPQTTEALHRAEGLVGTDLVIA